MKDKPESIFRTCAAGTALANRPTLITMARHRPNRDGEQVQTELKSNSVPVFTRIVHNWASFPKATLAGVPVYKVEEPNAHKAWAEYEAIGEEMVDGL